MANMLGDLPYVKGYMDNTITYTYNIIEYIQYLHTILDRLYKNKFYLKLYKYKFL